MQDPLTDLLRTGAKQLIHQLVEAELAELLEQHDQNLTCEGKQAVVRNGYHPERKIQTGIGAVSVAKALDLSKVQRAFFFDNPTNKIRQAAVCKRHIRTAL